MNTPSSIVLSGPPGVGKSAVGRALGVRLGRGAIDLDQLIERRTKRSVPAILKADGEAAFRALEAESLESLDAGTAGVIALGGGTLTTERGRAAARRRGVIVGLDAAPAVLGPRLAASPVERPLLQGAEPERALAELLERRRTTYAAVDRRVDGSDGVDAVAARVAEAVSGLELLFADVGGHKSRILLGRGLAEACAGAVAALQPQRSVLVVADTGIPAPARERYAAAIGALFPLHLVEVPGGEDVKSWSFLGELLERALAAGCGRQSVVVGLGGGATCDLAGLTAGLLARGAPLVLAPSTLLAQVDASIGGKTAVNTRAGRNLVGTFHPAHDVIVDVDLLASLDPGEYRSGLAELMKIALISDPGLFDEVARAKAATPASIARAIRHKAAIVARDPYERGERKLLNLGHTLGHALEAASNFQLRHGDAVAIGIAAICRYGVAKGGTSEAEKDRILAALENLGLPISADPALLDRCAPFLDQDKKADARALDLICLEGVGKVSIKRVSSGEAADLVRFGGRT